MQFIAGFSLNHVIERLREEHDAGPAAGSAWSSPLLSGPSSGRLYWQGVAGFLNGYLAGKSVAEIAQELGVSREWCSRNYRREALRLAGMHFVRSISVES